MRGGFWPVLNRIVTACIWVSGLSGREIRFRVGLRLML